VFAILNCFGQLILCFYVISRVKFACCMVDWIEFFINVKVELLGLDRLNSMPNHGGLFTVRKLWLIWINCL